MSESVNRWYEFGPFRIDADNHLLLRQGEPMPLTPKAVETLLALVRSSGEVLGKNELMRLVWPDSVVEEGNLTQHIYLLRKTLGKRDDGQSYIETLPRRGYRFAGEVRVVEMKDVTTPEGAEPEVPQTESGTAANRDREPGVFTPSADLPRGYMWLRVGAVLGAAALVLLAGLIYLRVSRNSPKTAIDPREGNGRGSAADRVAANSGAYHAYMQGCYYLDNQTTPVLESSITHFEQALSLDPGCAAAYAGIADCRVQLAFRYDVAEQHRAEAAPKAREAAARALELDADLPEAHAALGTVKHYLDSDFDGAEVEYRRAIELNPSYPHAHHDYAILLFTLGRLREAEAEIRRAAQLDPFSVSIAKNEADGFYFVRFYDQAIEQYRRALKLDPASFEVRRDLGWAYTCRGMYDEAVAEFIEAMRLLNASPDRLSALRQAYASSGIKGFWRKWLQLQQGRIRNGTIDPSYLALVYSFLGEKDQAFALLKKANEDRSLEPVTLEFEPIFDPLRSDSRYNVLLASSGLAP